MDSNCVVILSDKVEAATVSNLSEYTIIIIRLSNSNLRLSLGITFLWQSYNNTVISLSAPCSLSR